MKESPEPESYRTHDEHRAKMRKLTFADLVAQNRVLVGDAYSNRSARGLTQARLTRPGLYCDYRGD
jgi:hypothetical protein